MGCVSNSRSHENLLMPCAEITNCIEACDPTVPRHCRGGSGPVSVTLATGLYPIPSQPQPPPPDVTSENSRPFSSTAADCNNDSVVSSSLPTLRCMRSLIPVQHVVLQKRRQITSPLPRCQQLCTNQPSPEQHIPPPELPVCAIGAYRIPRPLFSAYVFVPLYSLLCLR